MTNLPPLYINSTPPPIDWENATTEEDNDDFDSFELTIESTEADDCSLSPPLQVVDAWSSSSGVPIKTLSDNHFVASDTPPPLTTIPANDVALKPKTVNNDVQDNDNKQDNAHDNNNEHKSKINENHILPFEAKLNDQLQQPEITIEVNNKSATPKSTSTHSVVEEEKATEKSLSANFYLGQHVLLEDVIDDVSDNEYTKSNNILDDNTDDFYKIYTMDYQITSDKIQKINDNDGDDVKQFNAAIKTLSTSVIEKNVEIVTETPENCEITTKNNANNYFTEEIANLNEKIKIENKHDSNIDAVVAQQPTTTTTTTTTNEFHCDNDVSKQNSSEFDNFDDDFDDFDDFQGFPVAVVAKKQDNETLKNTIDDVVDVDGKVDDDEDNDDDYDDDFGNFTKSADFPVRNNIGIEHKITENIPLNVAKTLQNIFPTINVENDKSIKCDIKNEKKKLEIEPIETTKALSYQWVNSDVRHSLIVSLGIDARNILFSDKWNKDVPRFAANLSFNPLIPIKPSTITGTTTTTTAIDAETTNGNVHVNPNANNINFERIECETNAIKTEATLNSVVEFDLNCVDIKNSLNVGSILKNSSPETILEREIFVESPTLCANDFSSNLLITNTAITSTAAATTTTTTTTITTTTTVDPALLLSDVVLNEQFIDARNSITKSVLNAAHIPKTSVVYNVMGNSLSHDDIEIPIDDVITTSTYAGPFKETHIYTPPKNDEISLKSNKSKVFPDSNCDFDYKIAAAGIVIDETVINKEYRDVEYNPGFISTLNRDETPSSTSSTISTSPCKSNKDEFHLATKMNNSINTDDDINDCEDDFSDFQYVKPTTITTTTSPTIAAISEKSALQQNNVALTTGTKATSQTSFMNKTKVEQEMNRDIIKRRDEMILSPAILLPQAISIADSNKPKIEWGETATNINPEELARIEQLYSTTTQTKYVTKNEELSAPTTQRSTLALYKNQGYQQNNTLSISASIAAASTAAAAAAAATNEDDDWSDFVSVPVPVPVSVNEQQQKQHQSQKQHQQQQKLQQHPKQNNISDFDTELTNWFKSATTITTTPMQSPKKQLKQHQQSQSQQQIQQQQQQQQQQQKQQQKQQQLQLQQQQKQMQTTNDDDWSDFISSSGHNSNSIAKSNVATTSIPTSYVAKTNNSTTWQGDNYFKDPLSIYEHQHQPHYHHHHHQQQHHYHQNYKLHQGHLAHTQKNLQYNNLYKNNNYKNNNHNNNVNQIPNANINNSSGNKLNVYAVLPNLGFVTPKPTTTTQATFINSLPKSTFITKK